MEVDQKQLELIVGTLGGPWVLGALLTPLLSVWLVRRYQRAIGRAMQQRVREAASPLPVPTPPPPTTTTGATPAIALDFATDVQPPGNATESDTRVLRRAALLQVIAGLVYALVASALMLHFIGGIDAGEMPFLLAYYATLLAFPIVGAVTLVTAADRRTALGVAAGYALAAGLVALGAGTEQTWPLAAVLWAAPTPLLLFLAHRRYRTVGPVLWLAASALIGSTACALLLPALGWGARWPPWAAPAGWLASLVLLALLAWLLLRLLAQLHRRKRTSDLILILDTHWFTCTVLYALVAVGVIAGDPSRAALDEPLVLLGGLWLFGAFAAWLLVFHGGLRWVRAARRSEPARSLLLLRVFGHGPRSEQLLEALAARWRYGGCIHLIGAPDLAASTLDPHEFLDFATGRLADNFVLGEDDLRRRLDSLDELPDPDGRYRVNEFYCHADTWEPAMAALAARSHAVLMDLRSFSGRNAGCLHELRRLVASAELHRVLLLVDDTTDMAQLRSVLDRLGRELDPSSRNFGSTLLRLRAVSLGRGGRAGIRRVVRLLAHLHS